MKKRFILWDNDGVLVDTERWYYEATREAIAPLGIDLSRETYLEYMSRAQSCWDIARNAGIAEEIVHKHRAERDEIYRAFVTTRDIAVDGAAEVVEVLSRSFRMAIVTSSDRRQIEWQHSGRPILKFMEFVITGEDAENYKPHPAPYLAALERFRARSEEAVAVEDSAQGLASACGAGIDCVLVKSGFTKPTDVLAAWRTIETIRELPALLQQM